MIDARRCSQQIEPGDVRVFSDQEKRVDDAPPSCYSAEFPHQCVGESTRAGFGFMRNMTEQRALHPWSNLRQIGNIFS